MNDNCASCCSWSDQDGGVCQNDELRRSLGALAGQDVRTRSDFYCRYHSPIPVWIFDAARACWEQEYPDKPDEEGVRGFVDNILCRWRKSEKRQTSSVWPPSGSCQWGKPGEPCCQPAAPVFIWGPQGSSHEFGFICKEHLEKAVGRKLDV